MCMAGFCATSDGESCVATRDSDSDSDSDSDDATVAMGSAKSQPLMAALFIGIAAGFVSTAVVLLVWARYSRTAADDQAYIQIE